MNIYQGPVDHSEPVKQSSRLAVTLHLLFLHMIHHLLCD